MSKLVLLRHGESVWNKMNVFTGWVDVPLSPKGIDEALAAGTRIAAITFEAVYVSTLIRAQQTAFLALSRSTSGRLPVMQHAGSTQDAEWAKLYNPSMEAVTLPVYADWHLNERYYGHLQGKNKEETAREYGADQVHLWRRSYDIQPPQGESLKDTAARTLPYFQEVIEPQVKAGKTLLISAHGNSLRAIVMYLKNLTREEVLHLEIATGDPIVFDWDGKAFKQAVL